MGKIYWVRGNTQTLLIPLEQEIVPQEGEIVTEPYYPVEGAVVKVILVGEFFYKKEGSRAKLTNRTGAEITVLATEPMESYIQRTMAS